MDPHPRRVNVTVSRLDRFMDSIFLRLGILPGAESDGRDLRSGVQLMDRRHTRGDPSVSVNATTTSSDGQCEFTT